LGKLKNSQSSSNELDLVKALKMEKFAETTVEEFHAEREKILEELVRCCSSTKDC